MPTDFPQTRAMLEVLTQDTTLPAGLRNDAALLLEQLGHVTPPPAPTAAVEIAPTDAARVADRATTWMADRGVADPLLAAQQPAATITSLPGVVRRRDMLPLPGYLTDVGARIEREYRGMLDLEPVLHALSQTIELSPAADRIGGALRTHFGELVRRYLAVKERVLAQ